MAKRIACPISLDTRGSNREQPVTTGISNRAALIWSGAELLRGAYQQSEFCKVTLPLTVIRRLDCVLEPTKADVPDRAKQLEAAGNTNPDPDGINSSPAGPCPSAARSRARRRSTPNVSE